MIKLVLVPNILLVLVLSLSGANAWVMGSITISCSVIVVIMSLLNDMKATSLVDLLVCIVFNVVTFIMLVTGYTTLQVIMLSIIAIICVVGSFILKQLGILDGFCK